MNLEQTGTQLTVIGTEHILYDSGSFKTFLGYADLTNMGPGDSIELRIKSKVLSTGPLLVAYFQSFSGVQSANGGLFQVSLPLPSDTEWQYTLKQTGGSPGNYDWKVISL